MAYGRFAPCVWSKLLQMATPANCSEASAGSETSIRREQSDHTPELRDMLRLCPFQSHETW